MTVERAIPPVPPARRRRWPRVAKGWVWSILPFAFTGAATYAWAGLKVSESDAFLHLRLGLWMLKGGPPSGDPSWTYGTHLDEWHNTMAAPEVIFALLYQTLGWGGIALVGLIPMAIATVCAWFALAQVAPRAAAVKGPGPARLVSLFSVAVLFMTPLWMTVRPMSMSFAVTPLFAVALVRIVNTGTFPSLKLLFPLVWLWACWHGYGMLTVPLLLGAAIAHIVGSFVAAGEGEHRREGLRALQRIKRQWYVLAGVFVATLLTPAGPGLWLSGFRIKRAAATVIIEWLPTSVTSTPGWIVLVLLAAWVGAVILTMFSVKTALNAGLRRSIATEFVFIVGTTTVLYGTIRTSALLALVLIVVAGNRLMRTPFFRDARPFRWEKWNPAPLALVLRWMLPVAGVVVLIAGMTQSGVKDNEVPLKLYAAMTPTMKAHPSDHRIFIDYNISSTAQLFLPKGVKVSLDGRTDRYGGQALIDYLDMTNGVKNWDRTLAQDYPGTTDMVLSSSAPLVSLLEKEGWTIQYTQTGSREWERKDNWLWMTAPNYPTPILAPAKHPTDG